MRALLTIALIGGLAMCGATLVRAEETQQAAVDPKDEKSPVKTCDATVTVEQAAAIQNELAAAVAAIQPADPDAASLISAAGSAAAAKYGNVTPNCPCSDNVLSYLAATLLQQAKLAGFPEATLRRAIALLAEQVSREMSYDQVCVAAAVNSGAKDEGTASIGGSGPTVDRTTPPSIIDSNPPASGS